MKVEGRCHCGEISYEAEVNPDNTIICHCMDCQTFSGAPYRVSVPVLIEKFQLRGTPKRYVKIGGSGAEVINTFCATCGTAMYSQKGETPAFVYLRIGSVKQRAQLVPKAQGFCQSAQPWAMDLGGVRVIPTPVARSPDT